MTLESSVVTLMHWSRREYSDLELSGVLASTSITFDMSVFELFAPLAWGGTVILAENVLLKYFWESLDGEGELEGPTHAG